MNNDEISITEAMQRAGFSRTWLWRLLQQGRIEGRRIGFMWAVSSSSLDHYLATRDRPGGYRRHSKAKRIGIDNDETGGYSPPIT